MNTNDSAAQTDRPRSSLSRRAVIVGAVFFAYAVLAIVIWQLSWMLLLVFAGLLAATFLTVLTDRLSRYSGLPRPWSLGLVLILLAGIALAGLYIAGDAVAQQAAELVEQLPRSVQHIRQYLESYPWGRQLLRTLPNSIGDIRMSQQTITQGSTTVVSTLTGFLGSLFIFAFVAVYLAVDPDIYLRGIVRLFPTASRRRIHDVLVEVGSTLRWWLAARLVSMAIVGVLTTLGLWIIGVPLALILGAVAALLTFIPNFGPILSAVPAVLLALANGPMTAVYVVVLYVAIQTIESLLIMPLINQKAVSLPPVLTISAQVGLGILFGGMGVAVATPLVAAMFVVVNQLYVEDYLERCE